MEIVGPHRVEAPATLVQAFQVAHVVLVRLGDQHCLRILSPHGLRQLPQDVLRRAVEDGERGVQPQTVNAVLPQPVEGVVDGQLAHVGAALVVEGVTPGGGVPAGEVVGRELAQVVAFGAEVVVHDVQQHRQPVLMGRFHQPPQAGRTAVGAAGREPVHPVVAPVAAAGELGHRHDFQRGDAEVAQVGQLARGGRERSLRRERADVALVDDEIAHTKPCRAGRLDHFRCLVDASRLAARVRVRIRSLAIDPKGIAGARALSGNERRPRAVRPSLHRQLRAPQDNSHAPGGGCPDAEPHPALLELRAQVYEPASARRVLTPCRGIVTQSGRLFSS